MKIASSVTELNALLADTHQKGLSLGFVPTMGALHRGHLSLIQKAKRQHKIVVCSIFVNPTQFNSQSDLAKYPRDLRKDARMLRSAGCDILFAPEIKDIYPPGLETEVNINFNGLDTVMEGKFRPGHFAGVAQVVNRLLQIVNPNKLYMGQKDFQQFTLVAHMLKKLKLPVTLVVCPTLREKNGLAMSSRNERLSKDLRSRADIIYKTLSSAKRRLKTHAVKEVIQFAMQKLAIPGFNPEYFSIVDGYTLKPIKNPEAHDYIVACVAVWAGEVRLIDNLILKKPK